MQNEAKIKEAKAVKFYYLRYGFVPRDPTIISLSPIALVEVPAREAVHSELGTGVVCLVQWEDGFITRGISFCNPVDQFIKRQGRNIALGRAVQARERGWFAEPVPMNTSAFVLSTASGLHYLSECNPELTEREKALFKNTAP